MIVEPKKIKCPFCKSKMSESDAVMSRSGDQFCSVHCLESSYMTKINILERRFSLYRDGWFTDREIIGRLGYENIMRDHTK